MRHFIIVLACALMCACKTHKLIEQTPVVLDNTHTSVEKTSSDNESLQERSDSVIIVVSEKGDTIRDTRIIRERVENYRRDTLYIFSTDTIKVPVKVHQIETEYKTPDWAWATMLTLFVLAIGLIIVIWVVAKRAHQH